MYKVNDIIVYKRDICKIVEIKKSLLNGKTYYIMTSISDDSLKIDIPVDLNVDYIRPVISNKTALDLIKRISIINTLPLDSKNLDNEYKTLFNSTSLDDLITIIKTSYLRNDNRIKSGKKASEK